ncbi:uncharacterized protein BT62DRAFT_1010752 [Guyanagaster necrorhizus]|uniref:Uncharacterized protein n=1 Tax=Guyanagaster necrorhizus TaxID=856835 RepID=A0A9P7VKC0_9AGAR|nr:uncharacterized protein BT62DRAFT_1010752 [Guyanagaster necrorhizus MCA 3950]KAG7442217.1 hypothetical protein BT62DRAFT_1010752 [Guyanagaster necrorhizus MCA 3950]
MRKIHFLDVCSIDVPSSLFATRDPLSCISMRRPLSICPPNVSRSRASKLVLPRMHPYLHEKIADRRIYYGRIDPRFSNAFLRHILGVHEGPLSRTPKMGGGAISFSWRTDLTLDEVFVIDAGWLADHSPKGHILRGFSLPVSSFPLTRLYFKFFLPVPEALTRLIMHSGLRSIVIAPSVPRRWASAVFAGSWWKDE